jgi:hypothetical protein
MNAYRFLCQPLHETHCWDYVTVAMMPETSADRLVSEWTLRDRGSRRWRYEPCLPTDIDFPKGTP